MSHSSDYDGQHNTPPPSDRKRSKSRSALVEVPQDDEYATTSIVMQLNSNASMREALKKQVEDLVSRFNFEPCWCRCLTVLSRPDDVNLYRTSSVQPMLTRLS